MTNPVVAICKSYNGFENVLFLIDADDLAQRNEIIPDSWTIVANVERVRRDEVVDIYGNRYQRFADNSLKLLTAASS